LKSYDKLENIDIILLILYKLRNRVTDRTVIELFYKKFDTFLELPYAKNPIFYSTNPLKFCFLAHYLLNTFNKKL